MTMIGANVWTREVVDVQIKDYNGPKGLYTGEIAVTTTLPHSTGKINYYHNGEVYDGEFLEAMIKEVENHTQRAHWRLTTKEQMKQDGYNHKPIMALGFSSEKGTLLEK